MTLAEMSPGDWIQAGGILVAIVTGGLFVWFGRFLERRDKQRESDQQARLVTAAIALELKDMKDCIEQIKGRIELRMRAGARTLEQVDFPTEIDLGPALEDQERLLLLGGNAAYETQRLVAMAMRLNRMIKGEGAFRNRSQVSVETFNQDLAECEKMLEQVTAMNT